MNFCLIGFFCFLMLKLTWLNFKTGKRSVRYQINAISYGMALGDGLARLGSLIMKMVCSILMVVLEGGFSFLC